ncbi:hypothetical protein [Candidatus Uabimicrobium sp. HlEnr_7]|uniref:hypothetical protein n=1 Tax=Candidatus Uabimicrobium helgolandensis TaxID=3095367 RepID=UPI003557A139
MIFFHGTSEIFLKDIKKNGLCSVTDDQWLTEITGENFCCIASKPNAGEGGSPSYFAVRGARDRNCDGYLVIIDIEENNSDVLTILDNKILDDYVRFHFFVREEFRLLGYELFKVWKKKSEPHLKKRKAKQTDRCIFSPCDQRGYYKDLRKDENRYVYNILGVEVSDEFLSFMQHVGIGEPFYQFLQLHFASIDESVYHNYCNTNTDLKSFWQNFYTRFPLQISQKKWQYINEWFSPSWLEKRSLKKATRNSQVLIKSVAPENIAGFMHISSPSGFIKKFRPGKSKGGSFSQMVWREVFQMIGK